MLIARIRAFFNAHCETCEALRSTIQVMKDHEAFLQAQINTLQDALMRATRVAPVPTKILPEGEAPEAIASMPPTWNTVRRRLEAKHQRKHEDNVAEHWAHRINELEKEAGINAG